jgi:hypothetical protein
MTPVIIGGIVVVLILLAVVAAYFMGFFGGEKVPASSSNDSALLEAMIDDSPKNSPTTNEVAASTPAASTRAAATPAALRCEEGQVESNGECISLNTTPASSSPAAHGGYNVHENQFLRNGRDPIWSPQWALGKSVTIDHCKDHCNAEPGCDGINVKVKNDDPTDVMCWVLNPSDQTTIMYPENPQPGYSQRSYTKTNANYKLLGE